MQKHLIRAILAAAASVALVPSVRGAILLSDTMTNATESGGLAGSAPDTLGSGTWTTFYYDSNTGELTPVTETDSTGAGFTPVTGGSSPITPISATRSITGSNFGAYTSHTNDGAYIGVPFATTGLITTSSTFTFGSTSVSATGPTAWALIALTTNLSDPDVLNTAGEVGPWMLVRPVASGGNNVQLYANDGTGTQIISTDVTSQAGATDTAELLFDPAAGTLNAIVDGTTILSTPYTYPAGSIPIVDGIEIGDRTNTGDASGSNPSSASFTAVTAAQAVPEPASLSLLGMCGLLLSRRRRSRFDRNQSASV